MDIESTGKKVFFSYAREDSEFTKQLAASLEDRGHSTWIDTARLRGGDDYQAVIAEEIPHSDVFIPILSRHSVESEWVAKEIACAERTKVPVIPVLKEQAIIPERLNISIGHLNRIDFSEFNPGEDPWAALAGAVAGKPAREFLPADGLPQNLREVIRKWEVSENRYQTMENNLKILGPWIGQKKDGDSIVDPMGAAMMLTAALHMGDNWKYWTERNDDSAVAVNELLDNLSGKIQHVRPKQRALYVLQFFDEGVLTEAIQARTPPLPAGLIKIFDEYVRTRKVKKYLVKLSQGDDRKLADYASKILHEIARFFGDGEVEDMDTGLPFV